MINDRELCDKGNYTFVVQMLTVSFLRYASPAAMLCFHRAQFNLSPKKKEKKTEMAAAKLYGGDMAMRLPSPMAHRRLSMLPSIASFAPRRNIVALAAKRSPKRLKYSTPRFTKVFYPLL